MQSAVPATGSAKRPCQSFHGNYECKLGCGGLVIRTVSVDLFLHGFVSWFACGVQSDYSICPATAAVDDRRRVGFLVHEQVEIVAHQFHVVHRVIKGERSGGENLAT